jgi:hypothetical protein
MHTILVWVLACQAQVSLRGFFFVCAKRQRIEEGGDGIEAAE